LLLDVHSQLAAIAACFCRSDKCRAVLSKVYDIDSDTWRLAHDAKPAEPRTDHAAVILPAGFCGGARPPVSRGEWARATIGQFRRWSL
jgi:hypothetical protein